MCGLRENRPPGDAASALIAVGAGGAFVDPKRRGSAQAKP
jgi:hypothetical protein